MEGLQRAFVLHSRPYSETSLIIDIFSESAGRVRLMAKGARSKRSRIRGALQPFTPLLVKWSGRHDMGNLRHAEAIGLALPLTGNALYCGFYLNELVVRLLTEQAAFPELFFQYVEALSALAANDDAEPTLRQFEIALLAALGYGVDFSCCAATGEPISPHLSYLFKPQLGFVCQSASACQALVPAFTVAAEPVFSGASVIAIGEGRFLSAAEKQAAKRFTRMALATYLGTKPLKSRELFLSRTRKLTE